MVEATVRLALALHSNSGAYAALLGAGISAAAGIPTGWQIVTDLIAKVAALEGALTGDDPVGWYRTRYGREPDYSQLLDDLAKSPTERNALLRGYFEPSRDDRLRGLKVPSAAHRGLAQLAKGGYLSVLLTTNFDRLLEQALEGVGITPTTLTTPDSLEGSVPFGRSRCTVVKLNGDYLDTRIKNTAAELDSYHPSVDRLLDRVLDEYGLIICGWSAEWDTALYRAFERCSTHRYSTFWAGRNPPRDRAVRLIEMRKAEVVRIKSPDSFFTELVTQVGALEKATSVGSAADGFRHKNLSTLPARSAAFFGRRTELEQITGFFRDSSARLLTLTGPGGTGKTALAVQAAAAIAGDYADGVFFVDLSSARETGGMLAAIARAIGIGEALDRPLVEELAAQLGDRHVLLVLDNLEQLAEAGNAVARMLKDCPGLNVLATSREALHVRAEHVFPVLPLDLPAADRRHVTAAELATCESAQLFVDRAQAVRPDFRLTDQNAAALAEICRRLDGLPLAIELAAARLALFTPEALLGHLENRLGLLRSGPRDLPERQRTLRAAMDWSYELLSSEEQRLLELLSAFSDATLPAIEIVAGQIEEADGHPLDVLDGLTSLVEKSLVRRIDRPGQETRIGMLETIREFAVEKLEQRPDLKTRARRGHAVYYADVANALRRDLAGSRRAVALAAMAAESQNLKAAWNFWVAQGDLQQLEKLADSLLILNDARGWYQDTVGLTTDMLAVLAASPATSDRISQEIDLRTSLARALMATRGFTPEVEEAFLKAIELFEGGGADARQQYSLLRGLASLHVFVGPADKTINLGREILALAEREKNPMMTIDGHLIIGATIGFAGDLEGGLDHLERAISLFATGPLRAEPGRGRNDPRVACLTTAALILWIKGRPDQSVARASEAVALAGELDYPFTSAFALFHSGLLYLWRREPEVALDRAAALLEVADEHDFQVWRATGNCILGGAQAALGRFEEGLSNVRRGMELYLGLRSPPVFWPMLLSVEAVANLAAGRAESGLIPIESAVELMSAGDGTAILPELLVVKGDLLRAAVADGSGADGAAEECYRRALDRALALNALMPRLRSAIRLHRILSDRGEQKQGAAILSAAYDAFSEGFEAVDLREARQLLTVPASRRQPVDPVAQPS